MTAVRATRSISYAIAGAILSLGAPTGLLIFRELYAPRPVTAELLSDRLTYLYVLLATAAVLAFVGFALGRQADRLAALSETDALTPLPNRRALRRRLTSELSRSVRQGTPLSLLLVDVDGLKQINDKQGHAAGDRVIRTVARAITAGLRESDFGARWGGDEFAILLANASPGAARSSAERLVTRVADHPAEDSGVSATVSVGIATLDPVNRRHVDIDAFVRAADSALYRAKESGRNRVHSA
jgi:two-component system, cell cycle response regulator